MPDQYSLKIRQHVANTKIGGASLLGPFGRPLVPIIDGMVETSQIDISLGPEIVWTQTRAEKKKLHTNPYYVTVPIMKVPNPEMLLAVPFLPNDPPLAGLGSNGPRVTC
jgi:hypothetical protein